MTLFMVVFDLHTMEKETPYKISYKSDMVDFLPIGTQIKLPNGNMLTLTGPCSLEKWIDMVRYSKHEDRNLDGIMNFHSEQMLSKGQKNSVDREDTCGISKLLHAVKATCGLRGEAATEALKKIKRLVEEEKYDPVKDEDPYLFKNLLFWTNCSEVLIYLVEQGASLIKTNKYGMTVAEVAFKEKEMKKFNTLLKCLHNEINKNDKRKESLIKEMRRLYFLASEVENQVVAVDLKKRLELITGIKDLD